MNAHEPLHLPEERDVPNPDAMFDAIMAAGSEMSDDTREFGAIDELAARRRSRRWLAPIAVAAGLGLLAVGAGLSHLIGQQPNSPAQSPSGSPSSVVSSTPTPSGGASLPVTTVSSTHSATTSSAESPSVTTPSTPASSGSAAAKTIEFEQYGKAELRYVTIERLPVPKGYNAPIQLEFVQGWYMKICVTDLPEGYPAGGELAIGAAAFRSELMPNAQALNQVPGENGHQPAYPPSGSKLAVGKCATGWVSFDFGGYVDTVPSNMLLTYKNSFGETVTWKMHP